MPCVLARTCLIILLIAAVSGCNSEPSDSDGAESAATTGSPPVTYAANIQTIFEENCAKCHIDRDPGKERGELRLDSLENALKGGKSGTVIQVGNSAESLMYQYVSGTHPDRKMPPKGDPLPADKVEAIKNWIDQGAS